MSILDLQDFLRLLMVVEERARVAFCDLGFHDREDLLQDVRLKAWQNAASLTRAGHDLGPGRDIRPLAKVVARRCVANAWSRFYARRGRLRIHALVVDPPARPRDLNADRLALREDVGAWLGTLSDTDNAVAAWLSTGRTTTEVAAELGRPREAIEKIRRRLRRSWRAFTNRNSGEARRWSCPTG